MSAKAKILIVDDNPSNRFSIRAILKGIDAELHEADNGFDALTMSLETDYALILLDVQMPEMDGYEVCEQLRADIRTADTPIIFLTAAYKETSNKMYGYSVGATDYLAKPIDDHILKAKVHVFLRLYSQYQQLEENNADLALAASVFESQQGIMITDANNIIVRVNTAFTKITNYTAEEVIGKNPRLLKSTYHDANFYVAMWHQIVNTGGYEGEVWNCRKSGEVYPAQLNITVVKDSAGIITHYVGAFTDISVRKTAEARASFLANHDKLTELPNRDLFYDRLSQAISQARRKSEMVALLFLDLDGFKPVNDAYGHEAGDVVLKVIAKRLQDCVRSMDTVARMGGDEFAIILSTLKHPSDAEVIAKKIIHNIAEAIQLNSTVSSGIGISIGIAIYPDHGNELDILMNAADRAMYDSKAAGKNTYTLSSSQNQERSNTPWINLDEVPRVGVAIIDEQHLKIVSMLNEMNDALKHNKKTTEEITLLLDAIISFTDYHFKTEEQLMHEYSYQSEDEINHKKSHEHLLNEVTYLKTQFIQGGELVFLQSLKDWFTIHITNVDKPLADFILKQDSK